MISVSLCMIVKNEEDVLERCLKSVAGLVDERLSQDTGPPIGPERLSTTLPTKSLIPGRMTFPPP